MSEEVANTIFDYVTSCEKEEIDVDQIKFLIDQSLEYFDLHSED